jgi:hypothetical protein
MHLYKLELKAEINGALTKPRAISRAGRCAVDHWPTTISPSLNRPLHPPSIGEAEQHSKDHVLQRRLLRR